jgi:hypothetical protein
MGLKLCSPSAVASSRAARVLVLFLVFGLVLVSLATAFLAAPFEWTRDVGGRVTGFVPYALRLSDGRVRLYYCGAGGIGSAISADGLNFVPEAGIRIPQGSPGAPEAIVCDPTVIVHGTGLRMYYKGQVRQGPPFNGEHRIFTARSDDGLTWVKEGMVIDGMLDGVFVGASVPDAIVLRDGTVRLYYVTGGYPAVGEPQGIASAMSTDGITFELERDPTIILPGLVDPGVIALPDGTFLMVAVFLNPDEAGKPDGVYALHSNDGRTFDDPRLDPDHLPIVRDSVPERKPVDPAIVRLRNGRYKVYYAEVGSFPQEVLSLTSKADVMIDIKPDSAPNSLDCQRGGGIVPVEFVGDDVFDPGEIDLDSLVVKGLGLATEFSVREVHDRVHAEDMDSDDDFDSLVHLEGGAFCDATVGFHLRESGPVVIRGRLKDGRPFTGIDLIRIVNR